MRGWRPDQSAIDDSALIRRMRSMPLLQLVSSTPSQLYAMGVDFLLHGSQRGLDGSEFLQRIRSKRSFRGSQSFHSFETRILEIYSKKDMHRVVFFHRGLL